MTNRGWPILCGTQRVGLCGFAFMPKNLKRYYGKHDLHFLTCTCYRRMTLFGSARSRGVFARILGEVRDRYGFSLVGYVVMPNHIHLLLSEPARGTPSTVMQVLKQRVSRQLRGKKRRGSKNQLSLQEKRCLVNSGSGDFMISMCGATRKRWRSCSICTSIR
jgi:REP element-mobilizing transposase RayT